MEKRILIAADHPALPGHFLGDPIVPGVVLLDEAAAAAREIAPGHRLGGVSWVKFSAPLRPDEPCVLRLTPGRGESLRFEFRVADRIIASGLLELEAQAPR
jgi:3-hydroxyacyl-[acyl-carrier-protein] dehydratase